MHLVNDYSGMNRVPPTLAELWETHDGLTPGMPNEIYDNTIHLSIKHF